MSERKKRKPVWDSEDEIKKLSGMREHNSWTGNGRHSSHGSGRYQEFSDSKSTFSRESRVHSGWRSWEPIEHPSASIISSFKNSPEGKEMGGSKGYHKNLSPGFDGTELLTYDHTYEYDRSHPQRYMGRGMSMSRSRSRKRGRSRSRSLSRGRERVGVRGWSRSRSKSDGYTSDQRRSRSPIRDYRRKSYGLSDKRSGPDRASLTCRDFTSGRYRRGSECRFFHPNSLSHRDSNFVEDDAAESWKSRADYSRIPKHSYRSGYESQNDEKFPNGSRSSAPCKDFVRGMCRWGDTCRFSHATLADSFGQGSRNMSFDKDFNHQQRKSEKLTCIYFAAGKCDRDNCRFSHDISNRSNLEGRLGEVTDSRSLHDKSTWRNTSKWDDTMITDTHKPTIRGENIFTDTTSTGVTGSRQNDGSWRTWGSTSDTGNRQTDDARKPWGSTEYTGNRQTDDARKPWGSTDDTGNRRTDDARKPWGSTDDTGNRRTDDARKPWGSTEYTGNRQTDDARKPWGSTDDTRNRQTDDARKPWGGTDDTRNRQTDDGRKPWGSTEYTANRQTDTGNRQTDDAWKPWGSTDDTGNRQTDDARKPWGSTDDTGNRQTDDAQKPWGSTDDTGNRQTDDARKPWGSTDDTGNKQIDYARKPWGSTGDTGNSQTDDARKPWGSTGDTGNSQTDDARKPWGSTGDTGNSQTDDARKPWGSTGDTGNSQTDDARKPWGSTGDSDSKHNDVGWGPWGCSFKNEDKNWGIEEPTSNSLNSEKQPSLPGESRSYGGDKWPSKAIVEDIISNKHEDLLLHGSQLQKYDDIVNLHVPIDSKENQVFSVEALQQNVSSASHIQQQHCRVIENNPMNSFGSDVFGDVKDTRFSNHPILLPRESLNQSDISMYPGHSSISSERDRGQNMLGTNPSNGADTNLNGPETQIVNPFSMQTHSHNSQKAVQSPVSIPQLITNLLTIKNSDQVTCSPVSTAVQYVSSVANPIKVGQSFENEQSQSYSGVDISNSRGVLPCLPSTTGRVPLANTASVQPNPGAVSVDLLTPMVNNREITKDGNNNLAHGTEQINRLQLERSSPSSVLGTELDGSKAKPPESPKQQEEIVANSGVIGSANATGEESKGFQENKPSETLDGHVKPEDEGANKDEKGMRVFKNALIEFVKEILKPSWKGGGMSREVHKTIVKKVVDKVSCTIQVEQVPKTQDKIEQYLSFSKPKITKLVQAYVERCQKADG